MNITQQLLTQTTNSEIKSFINNQIAARLSGKNPKYEVPTQQEVEHVVDYLNNRARKGKKLKLNKASYEQMRDKAAEWVERLKKKANGIVEVETDTETVKRWKSGMKLVKLVGENAYKREGKLMSHCVSSYFNSSKSNIYSLRDSNNNPHCTIEVVADGNQVQQIKGKGNGSIHPKYIQYVIDTLKYFNIDVRGSELCNLGYQELDSEYWKLIDYVYGDNVKTITFGGQRYYYKNQQPKAVVNEAKAVKWLRS